MTRKFVLPIWSFCGFFALNVHAQDAGPVSAEKTSNAEETTLPPPVGIEDLSHPEELTDVERPRFNELVAEGERARAAFRAVDAVLAYRKALDLYFDPMIAGRLGMALLLVNDPKYDAMVVNHLYHATSYAAGVNQAERDLFWQTYSRIRRRVCEIEVAANDVNVVISYDVLHKPSTGTSSFRTFVNQGATTFKASLAGYPDIEKGVECRDGKSLFVSFVFDKKPEVPPPPPPPPEIIILHDQAPTVPVALPPAPSNPLLPSRGRLSVGAGPVMILGVAPSPAFGAKLDLWYRERVFAIMVSARSGWTLGDFNNRPIDVFAFSALVGPCGRWQWFDACAFGATSVLFHDTDADQVYQVRSNNKIAFGGGLGIGAEYQLSPRLTMRFSGDIAALARETAVAVVNAEGATPIWQGGRFLTAISATMILNP